MGTYQYPLKMNLTQRDKLQKFADRERRSFNQAILFIIDKFLEELKNGDTTTATNTN